MKIYCLLIIGFFIMIGYSSLAQKTNETLQKSIFFSAGRSFTGTGDLTGLYILTGISKNYEKWNVTLQVATTMYAGNNPIFYSVASRPNELIDGSVRYNTFGVQLDAIGSYRIIKKLKHQLNAGIGPILKFQSSSIPDDYQILFPLFTGLPVPVVFYNNVSPQNTFAVGGIFKLAYDYNLNKRAYLGGAVSMQLDSNGDTIRNMGVTLGYRL